MKRGLLIGSGGSPDNKKLKDEIKKSDYVVAIDGGTNYLKDIGEVPNILIGDLDSINDEALKFIEDKKIETLKFPSEKDYTDMELGIEYLIDKNVDEIVIFGATGTRLDHTLANILLLEYISKKGLFGRIEDKNNTIYLVKDRLEVKSRENYYLSVIPIYDSGAIVTLKGFKYPLSEYHIEFSSTIGISNEIIDKKGTIEVHEGKVLVLISKD